MLLKTYFAVELYISLRDVEVSSVVPVELRIGGAPWARNVNRSSDSVALVLFGKFD